MPRQFSMRTISIVLIFLAQNAQYQRSHRCSSHGYNKAPPNKVAYLHFWVKLDALIPSFATPCADFDPPCVSHGEHDSGSLKLENKWPQGQRTRGGSAPCASSRDAISNGTGRFTITDPTGVDKKGEKERGSGFFRFPFLKKKTRPVLKITAVLLQTRWMPWKNGVFIWSRNKWDLKTSDLQEQMTECYCEETRSSSSKHSLSRTSRTDVSILVCLPHAGTCSPPVTKCLLFTTNENEVCVLGFDEAFLCWASKAQCGKSGEQNPGKQNFLCGQTREGFLSVPAYSDHVP